MNIIQFYTRTIKNIDILQLLDHIKNKEYKEFPYGGIAITRNDKVVTIPCIREIFKDPISGRKLAKPNMSNPCFGIRNKLGFTGSCTSCSKCIEESIYKIIDNELEMLEKIK